MASPLIMVVDDDDDYRAALEEMLEDEGYHVVSAASGAEALEYLKLGVRPSLLLLDLWMPGMDGWQVRRKLEEDDQLCKIPVVVMTATEPPSATTMNVRAVISKPSPLYDILLVVSKHC